MPCRKTSHDQRHDGVRARRGPQGRRPARSSNRAFVLRHRNARLAAKPSQMTSVATKARTISTTTHRRAKSRPVMPVLSALAGPTQPLSGRAGSPDLSAPVTTPHHQSCQSYERRTKRFGRQTPPDNAPGTGISPGQRRSRAANGRRSAPLTAAGLPIRITDHGCGRPSSGRPVRQPAHGLGCVLCNLAIKPPQGCYGSCSRSKSVALAAISRILAMTSRMWRSFAIHSL
jgi:hypothetical protein